MESAAERPSRFSWKPFLVLFLFGLLGAGVLFVLAPEAISPLDVLLLAIATAAGTHLARRVRLKSFIVARTADGTPVLAGLRHQILLAFAAGMAVALLITILDFVFLGLAGADLQELGVQTYPVPQLVLGVFYGGITEELLLRWGLMTLLVWLGWRVKRDSDSPPGSTIMCGAIVLAAIIFGAAHLPALAAAGSLTPVVVTRTVLLNALAGVVYGWVFWRRSLEAAMIAHAATHVGFFLFIPLVSALFSR